MEIVVPGGVVEEDVDADDVAFPSLDGVANSAAGGRGGSAAYGVGGWGVLLAF